MNRYIIKTYTRAGFVAAIPAHNGAHIRRWATPVAVQYKAKPAKSLLGYSQ
jgi:hypothetical protein